MRIIFAVTLFLVSSGVLKAQFYQLFGDQLIDLCEGGEGYYSLEVDFDLVRTEWTVIPGGTTILTTTDAYSAYILFTSPGTYIVVATSYNANNQIFSDSLSVVVTGFNLDFEVDACGPKDSITNCYEVCAFSETDIYLGGGTNYTWIVNGASSYEFVPPGFLHVVWGPGGPGSVIIQTIGQCQTEICFDIFPLPVADFSATPGISNDTITICKNQSIEFENHSYNGIDYEWQFGDGTSSNEFNPTHIYSVEGNYTVKLTANSICDCSDEKSIIIEVLPQPAPSLDCVNSVCPGGRQRYTVSDSDCSQFYWTVSSNGTIVNGGDPGDDFIEIIWEQGPDGYIDLTVGGCTEDYCSYTNRFRVPVISPNGPISGDVVVCSGEISTYSAPYFPGTVYTWSVGSLGTILGDQSRSSITVRWADVSATSTSEVQVTYENCFLECGGSDVINVTISPYFQITGDVEVCVGQEAAVTATGGFGVPTSAIVAWSLENGVGDEVASGTSPSDNWSYTFNVPPGIYEWVARNTSSTYCNDEVRLTIQVTASPGPPASILGEEQICPGVLYGYTVQPTGAFQTHWIVTDGASTFTYSGQSIQHVFGVTPPYQVMAFNADVQNSDCTSDPLVIDLETVGDITISGPSEVCLNQIESYEATLATGVEYTWEIIPSDHGEIKQSEINKTEIFFTETGPVTLRVTACGTVTDFPVIVNAFPSIVLPSPLSACSNEQVLVTTNFAGLQHIWRNENEVILGSIDQIDLYPGAYSVEVTDGNGCKNEQAFQINAYPSPDVSISTPHSTLYCVTLPGGLNIYANTDGVDYSFEWFKDGISLGAGGPVWNVTDFGGYHVVVTNQHGCSTASGTIYFGNCCPPMDCGVGVPGLPGGCTPIPYELNISRTEYQCDEHEYTFDLTEIVPGTGTWLLESASDGIIAVEYSDIFNYPYTKPGYYYLVGYAELAGFVYPPGSCFHLERIIDTIRAVADFAYSGKCANTAIEFEDLTTFLPGETIASWAWEFGDPTSGAANTSTLQHPNHTFSMGGIFTVTLQVTLTSGCTTNKTLQIEISDGPTISPVYDPIYCENEAMAMYGGNNLFNVVWNFGDPLSGVENMAFTDSVFHTYLVPDTYIVSIQAEDIYGCPGLGAVNVTIVPNSLNGDILIVPPSVCFGDTATLTAPAGGVSWAWSTGDTTEQIESSVSQPFNVLITDQYHCTYSPPSVFLEVLPEPVVVVKGRILYADGSVGPWTDSLLLCAGSEYEISAFSTSNVTYLWQNGATGPTLKFTNEAGTISSPGDYTYTVVATDVNNGCLSEPSDILVTIHELPVTPVIQLTAGSGCSLQANSLTVTNPQPGIQYLWSDGQEGIEIIVYNSGFYYVNALNSEGCSARSNVIFIDPSANVDQLPGGCYLLCDPAEVCIPEMQNVASYILYHNGNVIESGSGAPTDVILNQDGSYYFEVTSLNGCMARSNPLDVHLYTGVGDITIETWLDLDGDGVGDVLLPGITVVIESTDGMHEGTTETVLPGQFVFTDYPAADYIAFFDTELFPSQYKVVADSVQFSILTCDDSVVVQLIVEQNCTVLGVDVNYSICQGEQVVLGDSVWTAEGVYEMHMNSVSGCDSVFQVIIAEVDSILLHAQVWYDVDQSGSITPADTLLDAIGITVHGYLNGAGGMYFSDSNNAELGVFERDSFIVAIDLSLLPANLNALIGEEIVDDTLCGSAFVQLLVGSNCTAVQLIQSVSFCEGDSVYINGTWYFDESIVNYAVTDPVTLCDSIFEYQILMLQAPEITGEVKWNCISLGSIELSVMGESPFSYYWSNGSVGLDYLGELSPGEYIVTVTDGNGCAGTDTFYVDGTISLLNFDIQSGFVIHQGDSVLLEIEGDVQEPGLNFQWIPPAILTCDTCAETFAHPIASSEIYIIVTDANNCTYELATFIEVIPVDEIYAPNVFTPNTDGINDVWTLFSKLNTGIVHTLEVFDRWGNMVYKTGNVDFPALTGWDGKFRGKQCQTGVYAYKASVTLGDGREMLLKGDITLVR